MQINVTGITILKNTNYPDRVILYTDLPNTFHKYAGQPLLIGFDCEGDSREYVAKNFPNVHVNCIDMRKP